MGNSKIQGTTPLTLHVVTEVQPGIAPVKKLKPRPVKPEKKPKVKIVYKEEMERMTNKDWTALKKRLTYLLKYLQEEYDYYVDRWHGFKGGPSKSAQRRIRSKQREMIQALQVILNFEGQVNGRLFTVEDFRPSNWYRFYQGPDAIYEKYGVIPTRNLDKHPDALDELKSASESFKKVVSPDREFKACEHLKKFGPKYLE